MKDKNTISIVTICFNNKEELIETIQSVDSQTAMPYEHIIIDGSTTSDIKDYLETVEQPNYRKWLCERDKGISDAFNKGVLKATGEWVNMLNSGDTYYNEQVLQDVHDIFIEHTQITWMHAKFNMYRGGQWITIGKTFEKSKLYRGMRRICHQTMFVKKALHEKYGLYDLNEKIAMDYDFVCRIADEPFHFSEKIMAKFIPDGISSLQYVDALTHQKEVYERYFPKALKTKLWILRQRTLRGLLDSPLGNFLFSIKKALKLENW